MFRTPPHQLKLARSLAVGHGLTRSHNGLRLSALGAVSAPTVDPLLYWATHVDLVPLEPSCHTSKIFDDKIVSGAVPCQEGCMMVTCAIGVFFQSWTISRNTLDSVLLMNRGSFYF